MTFHNVRLPVEIEQGSRGGPSFNTTVSSITSGYEQRKAEWPNTRGQFDISYGMGDNTEVRDFFYCRRGRGHSFRFKDWADYQVGKEGAPQQIQVATGAANYDIQIYKKYGMYTRPITKPIADTLRMFHDGVEAAPSSFSVDPLTGIMSYNTAYLAGVIISVIVEFDIPVRFDTDSFDAVVLRPNVYSVGHMSLVEVLD